MTDMHAARPRKAVAIGEAMIEMAPVGDGLYRRGYAGDTFNTAWHMARALGAAARVGFVTQVGRDRLSDAFIAELADDGLETSCIGRDAERTMGLYLIELDGVERSFCYWRKHAAARRLADDPAWLAGAVADAELIHLSGITVAILAPDARSRLRDVLEAARARGARVSFDPNIRPALWTSAEEIRGTLPDFLAVTDIALPSFDDERKLWGDGSPEATVARLAGLGVGEIVVKNGQEPVVLSSGGVTSNISTPEVADIRDTTGAGDAFNAGYLAGRLLGQEPTIAVREGQKMAGAVICHFGARIPRASVPEVGPRDGERS